MYKERGYHVLRRQMYWSLPLGGFIPIIEGQTKAVAFWSDSIKCDQRKQEFRKPMMRGLLCSYIIEL